MSAAFGLIPGAGGDAWVWHRVAAELAARGYEAIPVALPAGDERAGLPEYADAVVAACAGREPLVLVAQSLGGFTAPLVCERLPVALLVLLNAMIPLPGETPGEWWSATGQGEAMRAQDEREGRAPSAEFDSEAYFMHDLPPEVRAELLTRPFAQSDAPFGSSLTVAAWPSVPTRVLVGAQDRFFPREFQRRVARERLDLAVEEVPAGHLAPLSAPREVADALIRYAREVARGG